MIEVDISFLKERVFVSCANYTCMDMKHGMIQAEFDVKKGTVIMPTRIDVWSDFV